MPRYDLFHHTVRVALTKDGWTITDDPFLIEYKGFRLQADLGAEKVFAAKKEEQRIVVEVKVFGTPSFVNELQKAVGQYLMYRTFTEIVNEHQLRLFVFNPTTEEVVAWIN